MILVCQKDNDLLVALTQSGVPFRRFDLWQEAIQHAKPGEVIFYLADHYPTPTASVTEDDLSVAKEKNLKLFVEYPKEFPGVSLGEPKPLEWERLVVSTESLSPDIHQHAILSPHACWTRPVERLDSDGDPVLVAARVAGYDHALFGLPEDTLPVLFPVGDNIWITTTKLSHFIQGRYAPTEAWRRLWKALITQITGETQVTELSWTPAVTTFSTPDEPLPSDADRQAFTRSAQWFHRHAVYSIDNKKGAIEGFESTIQHDGRQLQRPWLRADCISESAMALAFDWRINGSPESRLRACQMLDYVWFHPDFVVDDPQSPAYGLVNWYERGPVYYGDDNARVIMASLSAARQLGETRWEEPILRCILANLRTTGKLGFRRDRNNLDQFGSGPDGWKVFRDEETISYAPHYQAFLWAIYLWLYAMTGNEVFMSRTYTAIKMTMDAYPRWKWSTGLTQEMGQMLLPLVYLLRIDNSKQHQQWVDHLSNELLARMVPCGAIRESLGPSGIGIFEPPQSNEAYGKAEAPIIQAEGDPACDLLYTANFSFLTLRELAAVTNNPIHAEAADRLAGFLYRTQIRSSAQPFLDGAWMRSFDYEKWEYFGSSADLGWGPWCVESGWSNSWIASVFAMRHLGETLFDTAHSERVNRVLPKLLDEMGLNSSECVNTSETAF